MHGRTRSSLGRCKVSGRRALNAGAADCSRDSNPWVILLASEQELESAGGAAGGRRAKRLVAPLRSHRVESLAVVRVRCEVSRETSVLCGEGRAEMAQVGRRRAMPAGALEVSRETIPQVCCGYQQESMCNGLTPKGDSAGRCVRIGLIRRAIKPF